MFKTFIILKYFHIQTSAIKRKYPTLIVCIFLVSARTHSISRYIHIQTLCIHMRNVLRFLQHGTYHEVVRGGSYFCQSPNGVGSGVFLLKRKGGLTLFWEKKYQNSPALPPPRKNVPSIRGFGWAFKRRGLKHFEMIHSSVDQNRFLICQFLINL